MDKDAFKHYVETGGRARARALHSASRGAGVRQARYAVQDAGKVISAPRTARPVDGDDLPPREVRKWREDLLTWDEKVSLQTLLLLIAHC
jgi:hypothetical protein